MKKFFKMILWMGIIGFVITVAKKFIPNCCEQSEENCCDNEKEAED